MVGRRIGTGCIRGISCQDAFNDSRPVSDGRIRHRRSFRQRVFLRQDTVVTCRVTGIGRSSSLHPFATVPRVWLADSVVMNLKRRFARPARRYCRRCWRATLRTWSGRFARWRRRRAGLASRRDGRPFRAEPQHWRADRRSGAPDYRFAARRASDDLASRRNTSSRFAKPAPIR